MELFPFWTSISSNKLGREQIGAMFVENTKQTLTSGMMPGACGGGNFTTLAFSIAARQRLMSLAFACTWCTMERNLLIACKLFFKKTIRVT